MRRMILYRKIIYILFIIYSYNAYSQAGCGCKYTIQPSETYIDNKDLGAKPGDVVCIAAGKKGYLDLLNFHGAAGNPIIFRNCGGLVEIGGANWYYGMAFHGSSHFILDGTGSPAHNYGIKISGTIDGTTGLSIDRMSTDCEVHHIEISETGFAGMMVKSDPDCSGTPNHGNFIMKNVSIHDNYVHHTKGEGMYIGFPHFTGMGRFCDGVNVTWMYPHEIIGLKIYKNILDNNGREGIQVGCATSDVDIHDNVISNFGTRNQKWNRAAFHIATGTVCRFYSNTIYTGTGGGLWMNGKGDNYIYNNIITNVSSSGDEVFIMHDSLMDAGKGYHIINNTVVNAGGMAFKLYTNKSSTIINIMNNIVGATNGYFELTQSQAIFMNNLYNPKVKFFRFQDPANGDFHLKATSPCVDGGADMESMGVVNDLEYNIRPMALAYDVGALESPFERVYEEFVIYPNPVHTSGTIKLIILDDADATLKIVDQWGRDIALIYKGYLEGGKKYEFKFDAKYLAHAPYHFVLEGGEDTKVKTVIKVE